MLGADTAKFKRPMRLSAGLVFVLVTSSATAQLLGPTAMDDVAERYVNLVLALGQHDADYVDTYYGPPEWRAAAERARMPLAQIRGEVERLLSAVPEPAEVKRADELIVLRHQYLRRQLEAVLARMRMFSGTTLPFDEESLALYDTVAPTHPEAYFQPILDEVEALLPGRGSLIDRYDAFRKEFVIPSTRLSPVVDAAIAECRRRTLQYVELSSGESFRIAYVTNKPWGAYNVTG